MIFFDGKWRAKKQLLGIYTPLEEAKKEIKRRWNDEALKKRVGQFWGEGVPEPFKVNPQAVLFRYIATPNFEYDKGKEIADKLGLEYLLMEFFSDKFCTINPDKRGLGRMCFFHGKDKNNRDILSKENLFDLPDNDGKRFDEIVTDSNEKLIDFHHRIFKDMIGDGKTYDISNFAVKNGRGCKETYPYFMALFLCFGILLEDYDLNLKAERDFVAKTVKPAFDQATKIFGIRPLIVNLFDNFEYDYYWNCYPESIRKYLWVSTS